MNNKPENKPENNQQEATFQKPDVVMKDGNAIVKIKSVVSFAETKPK